MNYASHRPPSVLLVGREEALSHLRLALNCGSGPERVMAVAWSGPASHLRFGLKVAGEHARAVVLVSAATAVDGGYPAAIPRSVKRRLPPFVRVLQVVHRNVGGRDVYEVPGGVGMQVVRVAIKDAVLLRRKGVPGHRPSLPLLCTACGWGVPLPGRAGRCGACPRRSLGSRAA